MQFKDGKSGAGSRIPAAHFPTSEPTIILDLHPETPLATILGDAYVDRDDSHDATPEDVSYNPLAFISIRSPTSIPEVNVAVSSPISPFVPPSLSASPSLADAVEVTALPRRLDFGTERCDGPAPLQTANSEPEKTVEPVWPPIWHGVLYEVDLARLHQHVLDDPFDEPTPAPRLTQALNIMTTDLHSGNLFTDGYQTPTPAPRPLPTTYTRSHSQEFWMEEASDEEEVGEAIRIALNMLPDHNAPPRRGYRPRNSNTPVWHPTRHELRAWRLPRLDLDDPFLDEPAPRPTPTDSPPLPSFDSFASGLRPWSSATHSSSSSESSALESSDSCSPSASVAVSHLASDSSSASLQAPSPTPASPFTTSLVDTEEDDEPTHVFGIPLFSHNRVPFTHRDEDEDEIEEYNRIALNLPRESSAASSAEWVLPSDYDEDWEEFDAVMCLFPPLTLPADMEDPYGEPSSPVDSPWDEDDDKTRVFGIPVADLDRTPFTQHDADEEEINEYLCAALGLERWPDSNVPPAQGWSRRSDRDDKLDEYLRTALDFFPNTNVEPSIPADYDTDWVAVDLGTFGFPGIRVPEDMEDPYGEPTAPVDSPWAEDDNKTHVFGIPLADLDRTPFTQRDADEKEINEYLDAFFNAFFNYKLWPDSNVPPAQGWWKGSEYDKAKLDEFLRTALTMPLDSALPSTGWLLPSGHDRHRDELSAYAYPGFPIPEHLRIPIVRVPVDTG